MLDSPAAVVVKGLTPKPIIVRTLNVSCECDRLDPAHDYVGMVLYAYKGSSEWQLNGTRCKAGYIIIKRGDTLARTTGTGHGNLYKSVFGQEVDSDVLATGFSIKKGLVFAFNSGTLNQTIPGTSDKVVSQSEQELIKAALMRRYEAGWSHETKVYKISDDQDVLAVFPSDTGNGGSSFMDTDMLSSAA